MKQRLAIVLMACAAMIAAAPRPAHAAAEFSASIQINSPSDFYQPLTPYGSWVDVGSYGRCWHPRNVAADWQPYTVGYWQWTDAGWYWESDEPWAWACFHYGSWYNDPSTGWVWIPGTDWAPAWVTWRDSDDYIGWAPCGPGLSVLAPRFFTFCDIHHFRDHFTRRDLIENNPGIINRTHVIKDFQRQTADVDGRQRTIFANRGPGVDPIERATGAKFTARPVGDVVRETSRPENTRRDEGQRPGQKPAEEPRQQTPAPTGREQQRTYQQPEQKPAEPPKEQHQPTPAPTGREQERNYQQPMTPAAPRQPEQKAPEVQRPEVNPPTGQEQPRVYREVPNANPAPEQRREIPAPDQRPVTPPERILPPTGRDEAPRPDHHDAAPPSVRQAPAPKAPADGHDRDGNKKQDQ
jgi:hypothetical protein